MTKLTNEIKARILELEARNVSKADIARELGLNASTVRNFINRRNNPTFTVAQIAKALNVTEAEALARLSRKHDFYEIETPEDYAPTFEVLEQIASKFEGTTKEDWDVWLGTKGRARITSRDIKYVADVIGRELIYVRRLFKES